MSLRDAYRNPREDPRDSGFLNHIQEVLERWVRARNGGVYPVDMQVTIGRGPNGEVRNIAIKATVRVKGLIL